MGPRDQHLRRLDLVLGAERSQTSEDRVDFHARMPRVEVRQRRKLGHRLAIAARRDGGRGPAELSRDVHLERSNLDACCETQHIPLERCRMRLVEVVQVERQPALGCGDDAEVHEVGVAARLSEDPGRRHRCEIRRHDRGAPSKEGERRGDHPAARALSGDAFRSSSRTRSSRSTRATAWARRSSGRT